MSKRKKNKKWTSRRHRILKNIAAALFWPYIVLKYGVKVEKFKEEGNRAYLVLFNHQTAFDQFFVGMSFSRAVYFLATEDIFSNGFLSSLLRWAVAPISIKKQMTDVGAVMNCFKVAKEGGTVALAPEGNRTYGGKTAYINPAIAGLVKKLQLPVALYRIEGGYGVQPRWSNVVRNGKMRAYVAKVIEPEEYENLSTEEVLEMIKEGLYVDEGVADGKFYSNHRAEYLERAFYVCPTCGLSEFKSTGNYIACKCCHKKLEYGIDKKFRAVEGEFPFEFTTEWYEYQTQFINNLDTLQYVDAPMYTEIATVSDVILNKTKVLICKNASVSLYGDRIVINEKAVDEMELAFADVSAVSVLGRNKLNIYYGSKVYQLRAGKRFNALKYVNIFYRYKHIKNGDENATYLGI